MIYTRCRFVSVDFGEFLIAISITAQQDPKKKLEWAFSMYGMLIDHQVILRFDNRRFRFD